MKKKLLIISMLLSTNLLLKSADEPSLKRVKYSSIESQNSQELVSNVKSLKVQAGFAVIKKLINLEEQDFEKKLSLLPEDLKKHLTYLLNNSSIYSKLERTFLHQAENETQVKNLIKLGVDVNKQDKFKNTALNWLYQNEKNKAATELLKYVKEDTPNDFGVSALRLAVVTDPENFEKILQISPSFNTSKGCYSGLNLFSYICLKGSLDELKSLMNNNRINLNERNENSTSFLMNAISNKSSEIAKYLLKNNKVTIVDINQINSNGSTALMFACQYQSEIVKYLLEDNRVIDENINKVNIHNCIALMIACQYQPEAVKYLLESNRVTDAHINHGHSNGWTALMIACQYQPEAVKYLLENNRVTDEYINKIHSSGWTALMIACQYQPEAVKYLLESNRVTDAHINHANNGITALMCACKFQPKAVEYLLENNRVTVERVSKVAHDGHTALMIACQCQPEAVKLLLASNKVTVEHVNKVTNNGITALMFAARYNPDLIEQLVVSRADKAKVNNQNKKALDILNNYHPNINSKIRNLLED